MKVLRLVCSIWLAGFSLGSTADFPDLLVPEGVGVNIHFTRGHEKDLDLIAAAGFKFIRMDFSWGATERRKREYNWADYEDLAAGLEKRGMRAIFILDYSNGLYEEGVSPQHPESVAAFARWAGEAARHFKGRRIIWEIWNEPNISFWKPKPDVRQYITLAKATCQSVRENDPQASITAPASSEFPWEFLEEMFKAGLLEQLDAVSVHPYRNYEHGPETVLEDYLRLRSLIERYAPIDKKAMPIISGEWGYASHSKGVTQETQAAFIVRQQLVNLLNRVPLSIWYDWKNDGPDPDEREHHFGTVHSDLRPKPAYEAIQRMTKELSGYRVSHRLNVGNADAYVLLFTTLAGNQKIVAWCTGGEQVVTLDVGLDSPASVAVVDGKGNPQAVRLHERRLDLALSPLPGYVTFNERSSPLTAAASWEVQEPYSRQVQAGIKDGLSIRLAVHNPFATAVSAEASLSGAGLSIQKSVKLDPGKSLEVGMVGTIYRRDIPKIPVTLAVEIRDAADKTIGGSAEPVLFQIANPLNMAAAPIEKALRVTVEDAARASFSGYLEDGKQKRPVALTPATPVVSVEFNHLGSVGDHMVGPFNLVAESGEMVAQIPASRFHLLRATNYLARLDGDAKVAGSATIQKAAAPDENPPYSRVFALDYQFDDGWRFVGCEASPAIRFDARPKALGVWIYGDNSGNSLRVRVRDSSGQTFQPSGPNLSWVGWRWVTFDLQYLESAGHWGGANDGVVRGDLTLETALLVDGARHKTAGRIYFAGLTAMF